MSSAGKSHHASAWVALIAGGAAALFGSQVLVSPFSSGSNVAWAQTAQQVDDHEFQALPRPVAAVRPTSQMNAAVSTGQFEDLVKPTAVPTIAPTAVPTPLPTPTPTPKPPLFETGIASTYGEDDGFEGNLTACGQVFRTNIVQVAHKSLPCGTLIRIEDLDTGLSVTARVTDRGPYITGRIVDLSWGAFKQLDPSGPGLLNVNVYVLDQ